MNLRILVLKTDKLSTFLRPASNLLHSIIADGKSDFLKKLWLILRRGMFSGFLVKYNLPVTGINLKKYWDAHYLRLSKVVKYSVQGRTRSDLKPSYWYILFFEELLLAFQNPWRHNLVNKQIQYTYCPILLVKTSHACYIELILVFHGKSYYGFGCIEYLHNQGVVYQRLSMW